MPYQSNAAGAINALLQGVDRGLVAAAENYTTKVRARLDRGYTTGAFSHHARGVAGRVMYTPPFDVPGGRGITCGTSTTAVPYELYWELGFVAVAFVPSNGVRASSIGSQREGVYRRVEIWRPLLEENRDLLVRIIARNIERQSPGATFTASFGEAGR